MKKARSWARRLLEHGLLGDGAGVRGSPDKVLDIRERPPVPHLCTNHEIRTTDDEWRRRRRKQLNHPRMDHHLGRRARASPSRASDSHPPPSPPPSSPTPLRIRFKIPVEKPAGIRQTHPQEEEEEETDRPASPFSPPILAKERRAVPMDAGAPGRRGAYERSGAAATLIRTAATATSL